jgi:hypothetical protein
MPRLIGCPSCQQKLSIPESARPGHQLKCPACNTLLMVPSNTPTMKAGATRSEVEASTIKASSIRTHTMDKPLITPAPPPRSSAPASSPQVEPDDKPVVKKSKKKKGKKDKPPSDASFRYILGGSILFALVLLTCIVVFIPWGRLFGPSMPEAERVDVFVAVNSMGYNTGGVRVLNEKTAAYCIPGPRQIMVTRANPQGKYVLLRLKVPYADVDRAFAGARGQIVLSPSQVQVEHNGVTKEGVFVQDGYAEVGYFQLSYQPPLQDGPRVSLRDYLGPRTDLGQGVKTWTHEGTTKEYAQQMSFEDSNGMQVMISTGPERKDGGGGNIFEHAFGKKILGNQEAFTGSVEGYVYVDWNMGSGGFIVSGELEQPNEIGTNWAMKLIVELPPGVTNEVTLKIMGKTRKVKLK